MPWGRSFKEYRSMFALSEHDLKKRIVGCGDGPSNFNAILTKQRGSIISFDPLYRFSATEIRSRIDKCYPEVLEQTRKNSSKFNWTNIRSVEHLGQVRKTAMEEFLTDYSTGREEGRYVDASLPKIPIGDKEFELALCSHFLFLYSESFSQNFHLQSVEELCRISSEVRIFPLVDLNAKKSRHLEPTLSQLKDGGFDVKVETVPYEFQKGGNQMLRVRNL